MSHMKKTFPLLLLFIGALAGSGSTFLVLTLLARDLGVEGYGEFSSILSIATIISAFSIFGVGQLWLKMFGKNGTAAICWVAPSLRLIIFSLILSIVVFFCIGLYSGSEPRIFYFMGFYIIGQVSFELLVVVKQIESKYARQAIWQATPNVFRLICVIFISYFFHDAIGVDVVAALYGFVGIVIFTFSMYKLRFFYVGCRKEYFKIDKLKNAGSHVKSLKDVFSESWPFALSTIFAFIYLQSDMVMLRYISGVKEAGLYNVTFIITAAVMVFPTVVYSKYLAPKYHRWAFHDLNLFRKTYKFGFFVMAGTGLLVAFFVFFSSDYIVLILFGSDYQESIKLLKAVSFIFPLYFLTYSVGSVLSTGNNMKNKVYYMGAGALLNICLNLLLIPKYSAIGAILATFITYFFLICVYIYVVENKIFSIANFSK